MAPLYPLVLHLLPSSGLVLEHSLDNGSLLNQESSGDSAGVKDVLYCFSDQVMKQIYGKYWGTQYSSVRPMNG